MRDMTENISQASFVTAADNDQTLMSTSDSSASPTALFVLQNSAEDSERITKNDGARTLDKKNSSASINGGYSAANLEGSELENQIFNIHPEIVYKLSEFEGPLDLLLALIKNAKINIDDIFVSDVTHQYVEVIKNTPKEDFDFEYAGEFITLAAELVYLKSLRTLPQEEEEYEEDDPEILKSALIQKIKEYALMKEQSEKLKTLETINRFCRDPVFTEKDYRVSLTNFSLPKLIDAFARVLATAERNGAAANIPKKVMQDRFSVHEQMEHIRQLIALYRQMEFIDLFEDDFDKSDIVTTFLAVLELMKYGKLHVTQEEIFGKIMLYAVEDEGYIQPIVFEEIDDGKY